MKSFSEFMSEGKADKALAAYAKKSGGIDKNDMLAVADMMKSNPRDVDVEPNGPKLAPILFRSGGFPAVLHCRFRILNSWNGERSEVTFGAIWS